MDVSKLLEKAREAAERRNYDYAIELYLQARKLDPDNAPACRELRAFQDADLPAQCLLAESELTPDLRGRHRPSGQPGDDLPARAVGQRVEDDVESAQVRCHDDTVRPPRPTVNKAVDGRAVESALPGS